MCFILVCMLEANGVDLGTHNKITDTLVQKQTKLKKNIKGTVVYTERMRGILKIKKAHFFTILLLYSIMFFMLFKN